MHEPEAVDEVDCATMLFGDSHVRTGTADQCHGERHCPGRTVFHRDLNALKRKQALDPVSGVPWRPISNESKTLPLNSRGASSDRSDLVSTR